MQLSGMNIMLFSSVVGCMESYIFRPERGMAYAVGQGIGHGLGITIPSLAAEVLFGLSSVYVALGLNILVIMAKFGGIARQNAKMQAVAKVNQVIPSSTTHATTHETTS